MNPQYSIVIPAYNESARIGGALAEVLRTLDEKQWDAEVLVVNDGSSANTAAIRIVVDRLFSERTVAMVRNFPKRRKSTHRRKWPARRGLCAMRQPA